MAYIVVSKSLCQVVDTSATQPDLTDPDLIAVEVKSLVGIVVRRREEVFPAVGVMSYDITYQWVAGTAFTQAHVDAEVARQATKQDKYDNAVAAAKAAVDGTAIGVLTANQMRLLLLILCADQGWIDSGGKIAIG